MKHRISIITVSYNSIKTIEQTIRSVLSQGYESLEYIIVDGASNDGTLDVIQKYAIEHPDTIRYVSEKDNGIYDAMNKGIRMSTGDLIGIINSDDYYEPAAIRKVAEVCEKKRTNESFIAYGMVRILENEQEESIVMVSNHFLHNRPMMHPACFVSREAYNRIGLYDCKYRAAADYDLLLKMQISQQIEFLPIYEILANFRLGGMSSNYISYKETIEIKKKYGIIDQKQYLMQKMTAYIKRKVMKL